jgi:hypothetical protein
MARNVLIAAAVMIVLVAPIDAFAATAAPAAGAPNPDAAPVAPAPSGMAAPGTMAPSASITPAAPVNPSVTAPNADAGTPQVNVPPSGVTKPAN